MTEVLARKAVRLICTADWHIDRAAWRRRDIVGDSYHSLKQIVDLAIAERGILLAAGDLYDTADPDPESVGVVHRQCDRLEAAGVPLLFVVGQHERHRANGTWIGSHRWPTYVGDGRVVELAGLRFQGFDWTPASRVADDLLSRIDSTVDVLLLHQVAKELMGVDAEVSLADVPGDSLIVIGDYHVSCVFRVGRHVVVSPGSISLRAIDESPTKFAFVAANAGDDWSVVGRELRTRRVLRFAGDYVDSLVAAIDAADWDSGDDDAVLKPIAHVVSGDRSPDAARRLADVVGDRAHLILRTAVGGPEAAGPTPVAGFRSLEEAVRGASPAGDLAGELVLTLLRAGGRDLAAVLDDSRSRFVSGFDDRR